MFVVVEVVELNHSCLTNCSRDISHQVKKQKESDNTQPIFRFFLVEDISQPIRILSDRDRWFLFSLPVSIRESIVNYLAVSQNRCRLLPASLLGRRAKRIMKSFHQSDSSKCAFIQVHVSCFERSIFTLSLSVCLSFSSCLSSFIEKTEVVDFSSQMHSTVVTIGLLAILLLNLTHGQEPSAGSYEIREHSLNRPYPAGRLPPFIPSSRHNKEMLPVFSIFHRELLLAISWTYARHRSICASNIWFAEQSRWSVEQHSSLVSRLGNARAFQSAWHRQGTVRWRFRHLVRSRPTVVWYVQRSSSDWRSSLTKLTSRCCFWLSRLFPWTRHFHGHLLQPQWSA